MYIKLNYTADQQLNFVFRVIHQIINTPAITSIATLQSTASSGAWNSTLLQNLDANNSEIIRTGTGITALTTANTVSRYVKQAGEASTDSHHWCVQFSNFDDTSRKFYVSHTGPGAGALTSFFNLGSGTITAPSNFPPTSAPNLAGGNTGVGSNITYTNTLSNGTAYASSTSGFSNIRSFFCFVTDNCLIWCATLGTTYNVGFGPTYAASTNFMGPFIFSQYNRFDYHNNNTNNIIPLLYSNGRGASVGFGGTSTADWARVENVRDATTTTAAFRVFNLIDAYPTTSTSFSTISGPAVNWGVGSRFNDIHALNATLSGATSSAVGVSTRPVIFETVSTRYPSADLKSLTFGMLPFSWRNNSYYNAGGDCSARAGWFIFNGDYYPGDEFTYGGKTYDIWPTYFGYSTRVGIAVPKE